MSEIVKVFRMFVQREAMGRIGPFSRGIRVYRGAVARAKGGEKVKFFSGTIIFYSVMGVF